MSGAGLKRIHDFLRQERAAGEPNLEPSEISARALEDGSSLSARALSIFIRCYGSFAGDMALAFLARGGRNRRRKPLNLWRKLKLRRRIGYWGPA